MKSYRNQNLELFFYFLSSNISGEFIYTSWCLNCRTAILFCQTINLWWWAQIHWSSQRYSSRICTTGLYWKLSIRKWLPKCPQKILSGQNWPWSWILGWMWETGCESPQENGSDATWKGYYKLFTDCSRTTHLWRSISSRYYWQRIVLCHFLNHKLSMGPSNPEFWI